MAHRVTSAQGPAKRAGIRAGDELVRVNGETVVDALDYEALTACRRCVFTMRRQGREYTAVVRKGELQSAGLSFETPLMSNLRMCCNKCLFCFVEQLPACARDSLRVKDDDWRLSLMTGSYVTLTNLPDRGIDRIVRRHASPLYISVHAADPDLRARMLGTPLARRLPEQLDRLDKGGIGYHCQCVLCPGLNDGEALDDTIRQLSKRHPHALSLALVPVGLTGHREGLTPLRPYTREEARAVLEAADAWRERLLREIGTRFVFPSDEFYILAGEDVPSDGEYEGYRQIDDGVGMLRLFRTEFEQAFSEAGPLPAGKEPPVKAAAACGVSAAPFLEKLVRDAPVPGVDVRVVPVENRYFGSSVTVSALLTGSDLLRALRDREEQAFLITRTALRSEDMRFLDDMTLEELENALGRPVITVGRSGEDFLGALLSLRDMRRY